MSLFLTLPKASTPHFCYGETRGTVPLGILMDYLLIVSWGCPASALLYLFEPSHFTTTLHFWG